MQLCDCHLHVALVFFGIGFILNRFPSLYKLCWLFLLYLSLLLYAGCCNQGESRDARSAARRFYLLRGACPVCLELSLCVECTVRAFSVSLNVLCFRFLENRDRAKRGPKVLVFISLYIYIYICMYIYIYICV